MLRLLTSAAAAAALVAGLAGPVAAQDDTIKIAYIDPLSGAFAYTGEVGLKHFQYMADRINAAGGVAGGKKLEIVAFDNKVDPKEALVQLQKAIDQGIRYISQGNGSSVAHALLEAVDKHNRRNPDNPVLYLNYAAVDPALTNEKCTFSHFRFDADADMKMAALTDWLATQPDIKKVYLLNQDYSFGQAVRDAAVAMLADKRPDIEIVGNELHPLGKVKDFSPYIQKIQSSGAEAVITGNWGADMTLLVKAADSGGLDIPFVTYYGGGLGAPPAMGKAAVGKVMQVTEWHENVEGPPEMVAMMDEMEQKYGADLYYLRVVTMFEMLAKALNEVGEDDPVKVAFALEGMTHETPYGEVVMREDNHQLIQPLYISTLSDQAPRDVENTGFGFITDYRIEAEDTRLDTTCEMERPERT